VIIIPTLSTRFSTTGWVVPYEEAVTALPWAAVNPEEKVGPDFSVLKRHYAVGCDKDVPEGLRVDF